MASMLEIHSSGEHGGPVQGLLDDDLEDPQWWWFRPGRLQWLLR